MTILGKTLEYKTRAEEEGRSIAFVMIHSRFIAHGFVFLVEYRNRLYVLANSYDLDRELAAFPTTEYTELSSSIYGIPVIEDSEHILKVMAGVFVSAEQIGNL